MPNMPDPGQMPTVGVGVVGTGFGAAVLVPAFQSLDQVEVRGLCGSGLRRTQEIAGRLGVASATADPDALFARPDISLISIATPPQHHRDLVVAALEAGKHVMCEKPFGLSTAQAQQMLDTATRLNRLHFLDFEFRTLTARRRLGEVIRTGELGTISHVTITAMVAGECFPVIQGPGWWQDAARGGGWLGAMGSHYIDAVRDWFGEVTEVSGTLERRRIPRGVPAAASSEVTSDDGFVALLRTETGTFCTLTSACTARAQIGPRIDVYGSLGTAVLEDDSRLSVARGDETAQVTDFGLTRVDGDPIPHPSTEPCREWAKVVIRAVQSGQQIGPDFTDGVRCQQVMSAIRVSSEQGGIWTRVVDRKGHERS